MVFCTLTEIWQLQYMIFQQWWDGQYTCCIYAYHTAGLLMMNDDDDDDDYAR